MARLRYPLLLLVLSLLPAWGGEFPLLVVEGEHARRLRGPARLRRDNGASRTQCVELLGERAKVFVALRVARGGPYTAWARVRSASPRAAALSLRQDGGERLSAAVYGQKWQWVELGTVELERGTSPLRLGATGMLRVDQMALAGDPDYEPSGQEDSGPSFRRMRPEVYFADEFMRTKREAGAWQPVSGEWKIRELEVRERFDPTRSANAFSYMGTAKEGEPALAVTGYPFWRNYSVEASVRSLRGEPFGLVILRQDAENYYLFRCHPRGGTLELVRCLDGVTDHLATAQGRLRANQWYRVRLDACDGELSARMDGHEILRAVDHTFLTGQPGIWSAAEDGVFFDDVLARGYQRRVDRFRDEALEGWQVTGRWAPKGHGLAGSGRLLSLDPYGDFDAETRIAPGARAGIAFDWRDADNHALLVLEADAARIELREVREGESTVLVSAPLAQPAEPHRVRLRQREGRVWVFLGGRYALGAFRPHAGEGRVGLLASGEEARFGAIELVRAQSPPPTPPHNRIFAGEDTMAAWASAGSDWQVSAADGRTVAWHEMEHWGDCAARYELAEAGALGGTLGFAVRGDGSDPRSGCRLVVEPQKKGPPKLALYEGAEQVGSAPAPDGLETIELRWRARSAVAVADGQVVLWHRCAQPPAGRRVALWAEGWEPQLAQASVSSAHLVDDYFEAAPVDWRADSGTWNMRNRWTCSPQWSWMGGSSPHVAALWHKLRFRGDVSFHVFAAFQMKKIDGRIYRPRDLNLTLCGDGHDLASGYTLLYGGWNNTATALLRREEVVASTTALAKRPPTLLDTTPDTNQLHRKWWHLAVHKRGSRVACYVDDQLVLDYTDPQPLDGGSLCLWTHANAIMVARVYVTYEELGDTDNPLEPPRPPVEPPAPPPAVASSHSVQLQDFERGPGPWEQEGLSSRVGLSPRGEGFALEVTNPRAGGTFDLRMPFQPFDAMALPRLSFDYRIPPQVKVNLHVELGERTHAVVLTNPEARIAGIPILGRVPVKADAQWHTADIDLRALLLRCYPEAEELPVEGLSLGTRDKAHYLTAGFGGNYAGATYQLDNVRLWSPGPPKAQFSWDPELTVSYALDREPHTEPDEVPEEGEASSHEGLADGTWFFHAKARGADGEWSRTAHVPVVVDAAPPRVTATAPAAGAQSAAHTVRVDFADESGVDPRSLAVALGGQELAVQVVPSDPAAGYSPEAATFDPVAQRLAVDLTRLPLTFKDGQAVELSVGARDFRGQAMEAREVGWTFAASQDDQPPRLLKLEGSHPYLCHDDFETGFGQWAASSEYAIIERDGSTSGSGRYSLRIHNAYGGGPFPVTVRSEPFDAGRYPIVAFDYKIPNNLRADLVLTIDGSKHTVRFTDPHGSNCLGAIPGVKTDGQWHHTEFNLHEILTTSLPKAPSYVVEQLQFADTGFDGNARGVEYHIDNFCIAPAASTRNAPLEWKLVAHDPSGVPAYQYSLTTLPAAIEWQDSSRPSWKFRELGAGIYHFLVRARDGAGNWSEPLRRKILIDDLPPDVRAVHPKPDSADAEGRIRVTLADSPAGIDREQTTLTVAGKTYKPTEDGVAYDARSRTLTWSATELDEPVVLPNGKPVQTVLKTTDNVGNAASHTWTWKMDYSLDKAPPAAPFVARIPSDPLLRDTFEEDDGQWKPYGSYARLRRTGATAATGRRCLRIIARRSRRYFGAYAYRKRFDAMEYPVISFDYRMPPGLAMNLHVHTGSWRTIKLTSPTSNYTVVGSVELAADGKWHHADIDLLKFLKPKGSEKSLTIRYVLFSDFATRSVRAGTAFEIDNFAITAREDGETLRFEWTTVTDPTGIAGYATALDQKADTLPTELRGTETSAKFSDLKPGTWYLHVRARDGAGNWGPATHFPTRVPEPKKK
ncbi:MAG: hypothetical protein ACLF0G_11410 [Candidatus Brocadiia bacterium]